ncbi:histidine phosphatase family protein [Exiguobacterium flavidum]|uniref:histidine phosphatase family protein n=1 Tax=Exiguobacterium flavidum TaxID=2184695 RepID=UPI000DF8146A|nr:histidine phosphatase family protein [Exiguobacterium flavidum]
MTTMFLVRHAHSVYTPDERERPLSDSGKKDAERVARVLEMEHVDHIYSSPYVRAIETVEPLAKERGIEIILEEDLRERLLAPGEVPNFAEAVRHVWEHPDENPFGGETNEEAGRRGKEVVERILALHSNESVVIGTHGNLLALMLQQYDDRYGHDFWKALDMPDVHKVSFESGRMTVEKLWVK